MREVSELDFEGVDPHGLNIGSDSEGFYYYHDGSLTPRIYREKPKRGQKVGTSGQPDAPQSWDTVTTSLEEVETLLKFLQKSRKVVDRQLCSCLEFQILPPLRSEREAEERREHREENRLKRKAEMEERRKIWDAMPKKRSSRLERIEMERRAIEDERERIEEEERRVKEEKRRVLHEKAEQAPLLVDRRVKVLWEEDNTWYRGIVVDYDKEAGEHTIVYNDDSSSERLDFWSSDVQWVHDTDPPPVAPPATEAIEEDQVGVEEYVSDSIMVTGLDNGNHQHAPITIEDCALPAETENEMVDSETCQNTLKSSNGTAPVSQPTQSIPHHDLVGETELQTMPADLKVPISCVSSKEDCNEQHLDKCDVLEPKFRSSDSRVDNKPEALTSQQISENGELCMTVPNPAILTLSTNSDLEKFKSKELLVEKVGGEIPSLLLDVSGLKSSSNNIEVKCIDGHSTQAAPNLIKAGSSSHSEAENHTLAHEHSGETKKSTEAHENGCNENSPGDVKSELAGLQVMQQAMKQEL